MARSFPRELVRFLNRMHLGQSPVYLEYAYDFEPRWGNSGNPHLLALLERERGALTSNLQALSRLAPLVRSMTEAKEPFDWYNRQVPVVDALSIMHAAQRASANYLEIGSGYSTICARRAIDSLEGRQRPRIISIDPQPRTEINQLCDDVLRMPVERIDLSAFDVLKAGDVLFIDGSHRALMNSDVTMVMLDVIPRIPSGVLVGLHDIFLPFDYPSKWAERIYNEQYLLASYLLANPGYFQLHLANYWLGHISADVEPLSEIWSIVGTRAKERHGSAFWMVKA
jgi:hypothetical protein